ncbi:ATP-binding cassette domain-containing protein [Brevibacterium sp. LE-L]
MRSLPGRWSRSSIAPRRNHRQPTGLLEEIVFSCRNNLTQSKTFGSRQIGQLSGGQKKRTFVARGLAQGANVLLLDEPFAGVDKSSESTIVQLLRELADEGHCVLISTHDLHALPQLADEAILLLQSILFQGPVADALRPENLSLAFGLDIRRAEESE